MLYMAVALGEDKVRDRGALFPGNDKKYEQITTLVLMGYEENFLA